MTTQQRLQSHDDQKPYPRRIDHDAGCVSGLASAHAAGPTTRDWSATTGQTDQQVRSAFNASYLAMTTQAVEANAHRYHGGPKSND
jgi:hypothetical protein